MGFFFNNIHICKNEKVTVQAVQDYYRTEYGALGFKEVQNEEDADVRLYIYNPGSRWISVCGDRVEFESEDMIAEYCTSLSEAFLADVLAVGDYDSDFMLLNLVNAEEGFDAWAGVGEAEMFGIERETDWEAWGEKVTDAEAFEAAIEGYDAFAEDALEALEPLLGLAPQQGMFCPQLVEEGEYEGAIVLYFSSGR